jgi:hypothetical protein
VGVVIAWAIVLPGRALLNMETGSNQMSLAGALLYSCTAWIVTLKALIAGRWHLQPRLVLILRRFRKRDRRYAVVADNLAQACAGLAVPITIQDSSFRGGLPVGLKVLRQWSPVALLLTLLLLPAGFASLGVTATLSIWLVSCAAIAVFANRLMIRLGVFQAGVSDYKRVLEHIIHKIRRRRWLYAGTRAMTFPDEVWRDAIETAMHEADAVVIDVSEVSSALTWEISTVQRLIPPERVVLVWFDERTEEDRIRALQAEHSAILFGEQPEDPVPARVRQSLSGLVAPEWFDRCSLLPYERKRDRSGSTAFAAEATQLLVRCFAYAELDAKTDRKEQAVHT